MRKGASGLAALALVRIGLRSGRMPVGTPGMYSPPPMIHDLCRQTGSYAPDPPHHRDVVDGSVSAQQLPNSKITLTHQPFPF